MWWALGALIALTIAKRAQARPIPPRMGAGLVQAGRTPRGAQVYLYQRSADHLHRGIDIGAPRGSVVYAPRAGHVVAIWPDGQVSGYGNTVVLRHAEPDQTLYAHLDAFAPGLSVGQHVEAGTPIGRVGVTQAPRPPMVSAPHLHFEVHKAHTLAIRENNPRREDPMVWLRRYNVPIATGTV